MAGGQFDRRVVGDRAQVRGRVLRDSPPEFGCGKAVVVAGQQRPGQIAFFPHRTQGLPQRFGRGGFGVERIAREQHHPCPAFPRGLRQPGNRPMPRLTQAVPDALVIAAEGAAKM